jgi:hypothetical protein
MSVENVGCKQVLIEMNKKINNENEQSQEIQFVKKNFFYFFPKQSSKN